MKLKFLISLFVICSFALQAQDWQLKLRSTVELRTYKLTNKADISDDKLPGATVALYKGSALINQVQSDGNGDFVIDVPPNGEFILAVSYSGCNTKKFTILTTNVPSELANDNYKPTFGIEGVIMAKAFPTIDYSVLKQPLVRVRYVSNGKKFDDDEAYTGQMLSELSRIKEAETILINNFVSTNNAGDIALSKGDCPLAKANYEKAITIIPGEKYPVDQLAKVGDCLKAKEAAEKKAADEAAAKANAAKAAAEKAEADRLAKEKAAADKAEADKLAKEKEAVDKAAKDKMAADKAEADRLAKEKAAADKAEGDKLAKEKEAADKASKDKLATEKAEADRLAKEKAAAEKAEADKLTKDKEASDKAAKDKSAAEKAENERLAKQKALADKAEADKLAKERTASDKAAKDKAAADKAESDRLAKQKTATESGNGSSAQSGAGSGNQLSGSVPVSSGTSESNSVNSGDAKYSIPQALGADKYKATIKRAEELFKMKRYTEAKPVYEDALKQKPNDVLATNRLKEIERLQTK